MSNYKKIDAIDVKLLSYLKKNASLTATELSSMVHLSIQAINKRIANMGASGLIERFTIVTNPEKAGKPVFAFISVVLVSPDFINNFLTWANSEDNITGCYAVAGEYDYMLEIFSSSITTLNEQILKIKSIPGVARTLTTVVLQTYKRECSVIPEEQK